MRRPKRGCRHSGTNHVHEHVTFDKSTQEFYEILQIYDFQPKLGPSCGHARQPDRGVRREEPILERPALEQDSVVWGKLDRIRGEVQQEGKGLAHSESSRDVIQIACKVLEGQSLTFRRFSSSSPIWLPRSTPHVL